LTDRKLSQGVARVQQLRGTGSTSSHQSVTQSVSPCETGGPIPRLAGVCPPARNSRPSPCWTYRTVGIDDWPRPRHGPSTGCWQLETISINTLVREMHRTPRVWSGNATRPAGNRATSCRRKPEANASAVATQSSRLGVCSSLGLAGASATGIRVRNSRRTPRGIGFKSLLFWRSCA
jgi:hypothetical protein